MNAKAQKLQKFSATSSNFVVSILNFLLAGLALSGVALPDSPAAITGEIVNTLSTSGWIAVVGLVVVNVVSPLYHAFKNKTFSLVGILSSSNFWIQAGTLVASLLVLLGIEFPTGTVEQIVGAVYAKDWSGLLVILFSNVLNPLIRWFKDRFSGGQALQQAA